MVVANHLDDGGARYWVIDRSAGTRRLLAETGPGSDGVGVTVAADGDRIAYNRYETHPPGDDGWRIYDVAAGTTGTLASVGLAPAGFEQFSDDLEFALVRGADGALRRVDLDTGGSTPFVVEVDHLPRSADLSRLLRLSATPGSTYASATVVDTATGTTVREIGPFTREGLFGTSIRFLDRDTVLVNDAVPTGSPADGITDDGAFLVDVTSGAITRIDPGISKASTATATPDGARSLFWVTSPAISTRLAVPPAAPVEIAGTVGVYADPTLHVFAWADDGVASVRCV